VGLLFTIGPRLSEVALKGTTGWSVS